MSEKPIDGCSGCLCKICINCFCQHVCATPYGCDSKASECEDFEMPTQMDPNRTYTTAEIDELYIGIKEAEM